MHRRGLSFLAFVLGTVAAFLWPRPARLNGPIYSVPQVEAMLAHPLGQRAGQTVLVRAIVLPGCPWPNGGGVWYECRLVPASLSALLHRRNQTVHMTDILTLEAPYPDAARVLLHRLPVVGGFFPLQNENRSIDIDPHVYRVLLAPSRRCNSAVTGGLAPCPAAHYLGQAS